VSEVVLITYSTGHLISCFSSEFAASIVLHDILTNLSSKYSFYFLNSFLAYD